MEKVEYERLFYILIYSEIKVLEGVVIVFQVEFESVAALLCFKDSLDLLISWL